MSIFEVLERHGTAALFRFVGAVVLFLTLHAVRLPLVILARILEGVMRRVDAFAVRQATARPTRPINQFFTPHAQETHGAYT